MKAKESKAASKIFKQEELARELMKEIRNASKKNPNVILKSVRMGKKKYNIAELA